ncbi:MAG: hypothetical protein AAFV95_20685 [Bacteroidota bacterium]
MPKIEVHITCQQMTTDEIGAFESFCQSVDAKPIVILLPKGEHTQQPMISKIINCDSKEALAKKTRQLKNQFDTNGYEIVRVKMEVAPWDRDKAEHLFETGPDNYYEWHGRVQLEKEETIRAIVKQLGGHLSRNALKRDPKAKLITIREYGSEEMIKSRIHHLKTGLQQHGIEFAKEELEYCVYDSNVNLDKGWI